MLLSCPRLRLLTALENGYSAHAQPVYAALDTVHKNLCWQVEPAPRALNVSVVTLRCDCQNTQGALKVHLEKGTSIRCTF